MNNSKSGSTGKLIVWVVVIAAVALIYAVVNAQSSDNKSASDTPAAAQVTENTSSNTGEHAHGAGTDFADGTYTASSSYATPGGSEAVDVTITLMNNKVVDSSVQQTPSDPEAAEYQQQFRENYKSLVTGKDIGEINLSRVSGSSLTSRGFNDAIEHIKNQAHQHDS